jgi:hypothetical protein
MKRRFTADELRARDGRLVQATLTIVYPDDNGFIDDVILDAIIAAVKPAPPARRARLWHLAVVGAIGAAVYLGLWELGGWVLR